MWLLLLLCDIRGWTGECSSGTWYIRHMVERTDYKLLLWSLLYAYHFLIYTSWFKILYHFIPWMKGTALLKCLCQSKCCIISANGLCHNWLSSDTSVQISVSTTIWSESRSAWTPSGVRCRLHMIFPQDILRGGHCSGMPEPPIHIHIHEFILIKYTERDCRTYES